MIDIDVVIMFSVNLIVIIGGLGKGISVLIAVRDEIRDLRKDVGTAVPASGLMGRVDNLRKEVLTQRDSLIEITAELGMRRPGGRT